MSAKSILIVTTNALWPVRANGLSIRYYALLEKLAQDHAIDVLITGDPSATVDDPLVPHLCRVVSLPAATRGPTFAERLVTLARAASPFGVPFEFMRYRTREIKAAVTQMLKDVRYDAVHWVCAYDELNQMQGELKGTRVTCDLIDSPYLYYQRSRERNGIARHLRAFHYFDLWKAKRWERRFIEQVGDGKTVFISPIDANAAGENQRSFVIPNGIHADIPYAPDFRLAGNCIGFLGNMGYRPNVEGALKLHRDVYLPLKKERPGLTLKIIGRDPSPEILALSGDGVEVTGTVSNIWEHIREVDAFVFPMLSGSGLQNKILEAMLAGKPVVTTPICHESLGGRAGEEILIGHTDAELVSAVKVLLTDPQRYEQVARRGYAFVRANYDAARTVQRLERVLVP